MDVRAARDRVPLCVHVYDLVLDAIKREGLGPNDQLPGEVALAQGLRVSRTVLREALLLLEEDGHLSRNRGKRWTVAARQERAVGFADGFHRMVGQGVEPTQRLQCRVIEGNAFTEEHFGSSEPVLVWETIFSKGEDVVGSTLEFMIASAAPAALMADVKNQSDVATEPATLLDAIGPGRRARLSPVLWRIATVSPNTERLTWMKLSKHSVPAVLTVGFAESGTPVYVAKNLFDMARFPLTIDLHATDNIDHGRGDERFVEYAGVRSTHTKETDL